LADTIEGSMRFVQHRAAARGVTLTILPNQPLPRLHADPRKIKQVLINLLSNAVKFTPPGGVVSVATEINGGLKIRIADSGVGMTPDEIKTALEPFGQVRRDDDSANEGTGLGLPLSKSIVELHGGALEIESLPGKGTTVTVSLPQERLAAEPVAANAAAQATR
jgi:signal transduction histidine kinase